MIQIENVDFSYNDSPFIKGLSLRIKEGELHGIIGANGAGKSTLLRLMGGLYRARSGRILVNNTDIRNLSAIECARMVAYVFQENYTGFPFTVMQIVLLGRHPHRQNMFKDNDKDIKIAEEMLSLLGMYEMRDRLFRSLSGGEKQRVAIAAALAQDTPVILFDEPTAFTDIRYQSEIYRLIHAISKRQNLTSVVITHDINLAALYCDTVTALSKGSVVGTGTPAEIITESLLEKVYSTRVKIIRHPEEDVPLVVPVIK